MPPALLSREEVVARLLAVIRRQGYDGASLAQLSDATGLGKSSLYHHFPNGKDDMVAAVLDHLEAELDQDVLAPLRVPGTPAARLRRMCEGLDAFFQQGDEVCLLASLAIGDSARPFHPRVREIFNAWIEAIAAVLRETGMSPAAAGARAQDAVIRVEGALLLAHSLDDSRIFGRTIRALPGSLLPR